MAGRPRTPTELLALRGGFDRNPDRVRAIGPKNPEPIGDPPECLDEHEAECWREFVANAPAGVLTMGDVWTLAAACRIESRWRRGTWPRAQEIALLLRCMTELGATPASRSKVAAIGTDAEKPASPWDSLGKVPGQPAVPGQQAVRN